MSIKVKFHTGYSQNRWDRLLPRCKGEGYKVIYKDKSDTFKSFDEAKKCAMHIVKTKGVKQDVVTTVRINAVTSKGEEEALTALIYSHGVVYWP